MTDREALIRTYI
jgi:26S proteasome regulatory subunit T4